MPSTLKKSRLPSLHLTTQPYDRYFPELVRRNDLITPFVATGTLGEFDVMARVRGGGAMGQAQVGGARRGEAGRGGAGRGVPVCTTQAIMTAGVVAPQARKWICLPPLARPLSEWQEGSRAVLASSAAASPSCLYPRAAQPTLPRSPLLARRRRCGTASRGRCSCGSRSCGRRSRWPGC